MLKIKLIPAEYGDCILLSAIGDEKINILIDGGTRKTYKKFLCAEMEKIEHDNSKLDLLVCTHIDNDHIGGLVELLKKNNCKYIKEIWYNGFMQVVDKRYYSLHDINITENDNKVLDKIIQKGVVTDEEHEIGISDAMSFGVLAEQKSIPINSKVEGKAICSEFFNSSVKLNEKLSITIIGPTKENLKKLEERWAKDMMSCNYNFHVSNEIKLMEVFEYQLRQIKMFYAKEGIMINQMHDLEKYMGSLDVVDNSPVNASSIAFILDYNKKKYLFLGDAIIDDALLSNIKSVVGPKYRFEAMKLPHHGSRYNITLEFIERYTANEYYCLTNSERFEHPDMEVLSTLVCKDLKYKKLIFNYPIEVAHLLNDNEWKQRYNYEVVMGTGSSIVERRYE